MIIRVKKRMKPEKVEKKLLTRKKSKVLRAKDHLGKVKWNEDPLAYQIRKRNEWD